PQPGARKETGRVEARIQIKGYARELKDLQQLYQRLHAYPRYRVLPANHRPTKDLEYYTLDFNTEILLTERPPSPPKPAGPDGGRGAARSQGAQPPAEDAKGTKSASAGANTGRSAS